MEQHHNIAEPYYPWFASHSDDLQFEGRVTCDIIQGHVMHLLWDYCRKLRKYPLKTRRSTQHTCLQMFTSSLDDNSALSHWFEDVDSERGGHGQEEVMSQDMTEANT